MKYQGGKARVGKHIGPAIAEMTRGRVFHEPFVGGFNIVPRLGGSPSRIRCHDIHAGLIMMYQALQLGWAPPTRITESEYTDMKRLVKARGYEHPSEVFCAFACSFGGKEWGGYARSGTRNYASEGARGIERKVPYIKGVEFSQARYLDLKPAPGDVVYCDPPYKGTLAYRTGSFDSDSFYTLCETWSLSGVTVLVSEFSGPRDRGWDVLWQKERKTSLRKSYSDSDLETLYRVSAR